MPKRRAFIKQIGTGALAIGFIPVINSCNKSQPATIASVDTSDLPRSTPEEQGVSSQSLLNLYDEIEKSGIEFHSLMVVRHGRVITEGWWSPFAPELKHTLYSLSKSFTSTAVGLAVSEGLLTVNDKVISFFPDDTPDEISERLASMEVRNLLTMNTGHGTGTMGGMRAEPDGNWPKAFLAQELQHDPGTQFFYNTGATYMLSNIVQKLTGKTLIEYLTPRLFEPLGIEDADWETCPKGVNTGGYGLRVKTEDIAKLGLLYLQKGKWNEIQLLPESWVVEATKYQVPSQVDNGDWSEGYGYQFWRCIPENVYRGDGAYGQYCIVMPDQDAIVAITSESFNMQASMNIIWENLLPAFKDAALPANEDGQRALTEKTSKLALLPPAINASSPLVKEISGKLFTLEENEYGMKTIAINYSESGCQIQISKEDKSEVLNCGIQQWIETDQIKKIDDLNPIGARIPVDSKYVTSATWKDEKTLQVSLKFIETIHGDHIFLAFDDDNLSVSFLNSVDMGRGSEDQRPGIKGSIVQA